MTGLDVFNFLKQMVFRANLLVSFIDEDGFLIGEIYCSCFGDIDISGSLYLVWRKPVRCLELGIHNGCTLVKFIALKGEEK